MNTQEIAAIPAPSLCLPVTRIRSAVFLSVLVASAVVLPTVSHLTGLSVRSLLPMHWPVLLAGLAYGWRGGAIVGMLSPIISHLISGMPYPPMVPIMTVELGVYGALCGLLRERARLSGIFAVGIALVAGRATYIALSLLLAPYGNPTFATAIAALTPGLIAGAAQMLVLPPLAAWWVRSSRE